MKTITLILVSYDSKNSNKPIDTDDSQLFSPYVVPQEPKIVGRFCHATDEELAELG